MLLFLLNLLTLFLAASIPALDLGQLLRSLDRRDSQMTTIQISTVENRQYNLVVAIDNTFHDPTTDQPPSTFCNNPDGSSAGISCWVELALTLTTTDPTPCRVRLSQTTGDTLLPPPIAGPLEVSFNSPELTLTNMLKGVCCGDGCSAGAHSCVAGECSDGGEVSA